MHPEAQFICQENRGAGRGAGLPAGELPLSYSYARLPAALPTSLFTPGDGEGPQGWCGLLEAECSSAAAAVSMSHGRGGVGLASVGAAWGQAESPRLGGSAGGGLGGLTPSPQELPSGPPHLSLNPTLDPKGHCDFRGCHSRRLSRATLLVIPLTCTKDVSDSLALGILSDTGWMEFDSTRRCRPPGHPPPPWPIPSRARFPGARASAPALTFTHCGRRHPWRPRPKFRAEGPPHGTVWGQHLTETHPSVTPESPRLAHLAAHGHMCVIDLRAEF